MKTTFIGNRAEQQAVKHLIKQGYTIIDRNWRTRRCEIDIVARKANVVYLVEVKYRSTNSWGDGLDYITPKKLKQMALAAELWASVNDWQYDYRLSAIAVYGDDFIVTNFLSDL